MATLDGLLASTRKVFSACAQDNGAIIAAPPQMGRESKDYSFVWIRDGAFVASAAETLGMRLSEPFYAWCERMQAKDRRHLFYEKYTVSGKKTLPHFQPDQTGTLLLFLAAFCSTHPKRAARWKHLLTESADALCKVWKGDRFGLVSQDLWEERLCFPDMGEAFTYSLAACGAGLAAAAGLSGNARWEKAAGEMRALLLSQKRLGRSIGTLADRRIDASLLGLVWPFGVLSRKDPRAEDIVRRIERRLAERGGVHRYEQDEYDGWMYKGTVHRKKGAGTWPLLTFWLAIALAKTGRKREAKERFFSTLERLAGKDLIPEQLFSNTLQQSVTPLAWSHAMLVHAAAELRLL